MGAEDRPSTLAALGRGFVGLISLLLWLAVGAALVLRFSSRTPGRALRAVRALAALRRLPREPSALTRVCPGVLRAASGEEAQAGGAPRPVVLYFTGTAESAEACFAAFHGLTAQLPELAHALEYVVEPPDSKGAYYSPTALASRVFQQISPIVRRHAGPFVLVGMSRGGVAALEMGSRIAEELGKPAAALALSAPLSVPRKLPPAVRAMAAFEPVVEGLSAASARVPASWARHVARSVRLSHLFLTAMVLDDLQIHDLRELSLARSALARTGAVPGSARATYEFRWLLNLTPREADLFVRTQVELLGRSALYHARFVWGEADTWVPAAASERALLEAAARIPGAPERLSAEVVPGLNHALFRANERGVLPVLRGLAACAARAQAQMLSERRTAERALALERELRTAEDMAGE